jgi:eukaryotic-like serine/threonine-protein kinase
MRRQISRYSFLGCRIRLPGRRPPGSGTLARVERLGAGSVVAGRYRLVAPVPAREPGGVWRAADELTGAEVAVKLLAPHPADDAAAGLRFRLVGRAAFQLCGAGIAPVYDFGEAVLQDGLAVPYLVRELVGGPTLADRLAAGPLPAAQVLRLVAALAAALTVAHRAGVPHGHLVPANVMLTREVKVTDFGLAPLSPRRAPESADVLSYTAPELASGGPATPAADMYALGVIVTACLTGIPLKAAGPAAPDAVPSDPVPSAPMPPSLAALWAACLGPSPAERPTAAYAAAMSQQALRDRPAGLTPVPRPARPIGLPHRPTEADPAQRPGCVPGQPREPAQPPAPGGQLGSTQRTAEPRPALRPETAPEQSREPADPPVPAGPPSCSERTAEPGSPPRSETGPDQPREPANRPLRGRPRPAGPGRAPRHRRLASLGKVAAATAATSGILALLLFALARQQDGPTARGGTSRTRTSATSGAPAASRPPSPDVTSPTQATPPAPASPLIVLRRISATIRTYAGTGQIRPDVRVDLDNLIQPVETDLTAGRAAPVAPLVSTLLAKVATRLAEGALTHSAARALDTEIDALHRSAG